MKTAELSPSKNYILGCHPHGIMSVGAFSCFGTESCGFAEAFPGVRSCLAILAGLFRLPVFRDYIMSAGRLRTGKGVSLVDLSEFVTHNFVAGRDGGLYIIFILLYKVHK